MLCLTLYRQPHPRTEEVVIDTPAGEVVLILTDVMTYGRCKVGIEAPRECNIYRRKVRREPPALGEAS